MLASSNMELVVLNKETNLAVLRHTHLSPGAMLPYFQNEEF